MRMRFNAILSIMLVFILGCTSDSGSEVRKPALAGRWYPSNPVKLKALIDGMLAGAPSHGVKSRALMLIVPHAGYAYSGKIAAMGYAAVRGMKPDCIVIIAPSHHRHADGCLLISADYFETPLGKVKVDRTIIGKLLSSPLFSLDAGAHLKEHAIEIHLPFIQRLFGSRGDYTILPVLTGTLGITDARRVAAELAKSLRNKTSPLIIISSDFTHYGESFGYLPFSHQDSAVLRVKLKKLDYGAIDPILKKDPDTFHRYTAETGITVCGRNAILAALFLPINNYRATLLGYATSGDITGDYRTSVSYAAIAIHGKLSIDSDTPRIDTGLSKKDRVFLLELARRQIHSFLFRKTGITPDEQGIPPSCRARLGVFVTLKTGGRLRGCIGRIDAPKPLYLGVMENARNAAFADPRFPPVKENEYSFLSIEISVLTPLTPVLSEDEIVVGRDGLVVEMGRNRGVLLPQVPVDWNWSRGEFLVQTCRKAGLPDFAWKHGARVFSFQAEVFGEEGKGTVKNGKP